MIRANFDYEKELFYGTKDEKIAGEFEYLYWFLEDRQESLYSKKNYSLEYLDYVQSITSSEPKLVNSYSKNWWGKLINIELEKKLNSKLTTTELAIKYGWCHHSTKIISNITEIQLSPNTDYVLKNPNSMSGKSFLFLNEKMPQLSNAKKMLDDSACIFEQWLKREFDFGTYFFAEKDNFESYFNLSNNQGNYKGTYVFSNPLSSLDFLQEKGIHLDPYLNFINTIVEIYKKLGATDSFSIDSFKYDEGVYYLSEINYRKTMGYLALKCRKFLNQEDVGAFVIHKPKNKFKSLHELLSAINAKYDFHSKEGALLFSPHDHYFLTFFVAGKDLAQVNQLLEDIAKL